jgi:glyoxylase-like metal-dependent hydrolase (beta-lactamase superfamily II)
MLNDYEKNLELTLPDITFSDKMVLDLGDITLQMYYFGEGLHTGDDILVYCPEEKILFSGDLFYKGYFGFAFSHKFDIERWITVLDEIFNEANIIEWVYDCHNGRMPGEYIALYHNYMKDVWESLLTAKEKGLDLDTVLEHYSYEERFSYINGSGLDSSILKRGHVDNLKNTWYCINNIDPKIE